MRPSTLEQATRLAGAAILAAATATPCLAQSANTPAALDPRDDATTSTEAERGAETALAAERLEAELDELIDARGRPRRAAEAALRLDALAEQAQRRRATATDAGLQRRLAGVELRAMHALVGVAADEGGAFRASLRSTQLRAAASRLAGDDDPAAAALGEYFLAAAELGELRRDPGPVEGKTRVAAERLATLRAASPAAPAGLRDAATLAHALLVGRTGQAAGDGATIRAAARAASDGDTPMRTPTPRDELARFAHRAALLDAGATLGDLLEPEALGVVPAETTIVHYFHDDAPASKASFFALRRLRQRFADDRLALVSVALPDGGSDAAAPPAGVTWPVRRTVGGELGVATLRVAAVPTLAVFDGDGRLVLIGENDAVLAGVRRRLDTAAPSP